MKTARKKNIFLIIGILCILFGIFLGAYSGSKGEILGILEKNYNFPEGYTVGAWIWEDPSTLSEIEIQEALQFAESEGINAIYLNIEEYINILESDQSEASMGKFQKGIENFLSKAEELEIAVHGLAGASEWAATSHSYIPKTLLDFVINYNGNADNSHLFSGMQFDIEFYNQKNFTKRFNEYSVEYLNLVNDLNSTAEKHRLESGAKFELGFTMPYWLDKNNQVVKEIGWRNAEKSAVGHCLDILKSSSENYLVIMAYRNNPDGKNGSIALAQDEINLASESADGAKILVGMETSPNEERHITFWDTDKNKVKESANIITDKFSNDSAYGGIAVHTLDAYRKLEN